MGDLLVAANTGASVEAALDTMGPEFKFFAVGNPPLPLGADKRGLMVPCQRSMVKP